MDRTAFEAELQREGREIVSVTMQPNQVKADHAHDFDARLMVVAGEMTVDFGDRRETYATGDTFAVPLGHRHAEHAGPAGATYIAGRLKAATA
ncbi:MAG TPA: cupin domain-containing protein [Acetobacteraceae bacterium]|jgi:quercetin dioxygenase-like cupin family protein|nr:cupin domain-containing protein [Acetobacteraceae bacterium]